MQCFPTVLMPFDAVHTGCVKDCLDGMGNPAGPSIRRALNRLGIIHYMSVSVVPDPAPGGPGAVLVLEASADGSMRRALAGIAEALQEPLRDLLRAADLDEQAPDLATFLVAHECGLGQGWGARTLGLPFAGTPGLTVRRIWREARLALRIARMRDLLASDEAALVKLEKVRAVLWRRGDLKWAFVAETVPHLDAMEQSKIGAVARTLPTVLATLLWPLPLALLLLLVVPWWVLAVAAAAAPLGLLARLRQLERSDVPDTAPPDAGHVRAVMDLENFTPQNLLVTVSDMKPGWLRRLTLRVAFVVIGTMAALQFRPGFLADLGSIHFARWVLLPGGRKLAFFSNYDGSLESYLEDFIQEAHEGVTGIWSNAAGFPRSRWLFLDGARDGDRLRRYVLRQQIPARFWYSAYPSLPAPRIRANAVICRGIAAAATPDEAEEWLACFGASGRLLPSKRPTRPHAILIDKIEQWVPKTQPAPLAPLEAHSIPTLVFGGRKRLPYSASLLVRLEGGPAHARAWLAGIAPQVTHGADRGAEEVLALALAASALGPDRLALTPGDLATFSPAFLNGMSAPPRARALSDVGVSAPEGWAWGGPVHPVDALLVLYDKYDWRLRDRLKAMAAGLGDFGHTVVSTVRHLPLANGRMSEPFGFTDGVSQPLVRGIDPAGADPSATLHEAGEFVLGYRDNRGFLPPSPSVAAARDPGGLLHRLEDGRHDLGRNGTYLVARQLDQDVGAFQAWLDEAAARVCAGTSSLAAVPPGLAQELIAAKLVGRWRNGSATAQHPAFPGVHDRNDFLYGSVDPSGLGCPLGAHTRRANPRDSFAPGSDQQLALTNRHRVLRVGRQYAATEPDGKPGLMFMCVNADIGRQFEFIQQTWLMGRNFHGLDGERDALMRPDGHKPCIFTIHTPHGPLRLPLQQSFVTVRGGEYFFMPGREALHVLTADAPG